MNRRLVPAIRLHVLACIVLLAGCEGRLTSASQDVDAGSVLVHRTASAYTGFRANNGTIEFAGRHRVTGPDAVMFAVAYPDAPLAAGTDLTVRVDFTPTSTGRKTAEYTPRMLAGEVSAGSFPLRLSGTGLAYYEWPNTPVTGVGSPDGHDFKEVCVSTSGTWTYNITNNTANPVELITHFLPPAPATITVAPTRLTIPANQARSVTVTFTPTRAERSSSTLVLRSPVGDQDRVGVWTRGVGKNC